MQKPRSTAPLIDGVRLRAGWQRSRKQSLVHVGLPNGNPPGTRPQQLFQFRPASREGDMPPVYGFDTHRTSGVAIDALQCLTGLFGEQFDMLRHAGAGQIGVTDSLNFRPDVRLSITSSASKEDRPMRRGLRVAGTRSRPQPSSLRHSLREFYRIKKGRMGEASGI